MAIYDHANLAHKFIEEWQTASTTVKAHTSGSTGKPKEILLKKSDMTVSAKATCDFFAINRNSQLVLPLSIDYIAGKMMVVRALLSGADLTVIPPGNDTLTNYYIPYEIDLAAIVPSQIPSLILASKTHKFNNVIIGGAPMSVQQQISLSDNGINAWATYGMTETCSHVALRHISKNTYIALPGIKFGIDARNCLTIHSEQMSLGVFQTNDVARLISDTEFQWLGRFDNVINSGGVKIHPEEDEALLTNVIDDVAFYISSMPHDKWGEVPVLVLEGKDNGITDDYLNLAAKTLPKYHAPKSAKWVSEFERTSSGKIKRMKF